MDAKERERLIRDKIARVPWFHAFEVAPGIVTPGHIPVDGRQHLDSLRIPASLSGRTAIDVGTWDGYVAFELARRGATTTALDIQDPSRTGFNTAKEILGAEVEYVQAPQGVYALPEAVQGRTFDLVMFLAVFNAIKNPIGAFDALATIMHHDSVLYVEGECFDCYAEDSGGRPSKHPLVESFAQLDIPLALCYPRRYKNADNWFVPNVACVKSWLSAAGLEPFEIHKMVNKSCSPPNQRVLCFVRKTREHRLVEHDLV